MGLMRDSKLRKQLQNPEDKKSYKVIGSMPGTAGRSPLAKKKQDAAFDKKVEGDLAMLKAIKSKKEKEETKAVHLIPKYADTVEAMMEGNSKHSFLGLFLVWLFDVKDIPRAMRLAIYCLAHSVPLPATFKRDMPTYLCDVVSEWAEEQHEKGLSAEPWLSAIVQRAEDFDLVDEVRAKLHRITGLIAYKKGLYHEAVTSLTIAFEYGALVKTALAKAQKKLDAQCLEADLESSREDD